MAAAPSASAERAASPTTTATAAAAAPPCLTFACQICRARISLAGPLDAAAAGEPLLPLPTALSAELHQHPQWQARGMDESFVVLPTTAAAAAAASAARSAARDGGGGGGGAPLPSFAASAAPPGVSPPLSPSGGGGGGMDAKLRALAALFEAASTATGADHPLCLDCAARLRDEAAAQAAEAEADAAAYERALARLRRPRPQEQGQRGARGAAASSASEGGGDGDASSPPAPVSAAAFEAEAAALAERERAARARSGALAARLAALRAELAQLDATDGAALDASAARYWRDALATQAALDHHVGERDALLARTERASARLAALRGTSALNDACRIWHEGPFGTIGGFRLGRTPEHPVPWDEINAAWGLCVLLLAAMARSARVTFSAGRRLLPLGSRARVADGRGTHDLFGPVSRLWTAPYDRAMAAYVGCLGEFGEFARARDLAEGRSPPFEFPFPIDGGGGGGGGAAAVGGHGVRLALNKEARWTRALKLMLADLKVALQWTARREMGAQQAAARRAAPVPLQPESVGAAGG